MAQAASNQFGRWSQENFFRYGSQSLDRFIAHKTELQAVIEAYRAETAISQILAGKINAHHRDEVRGLARQVFQSDVNLRPDHQAGTLTVELHGMSTPRDNEAVEHLCRELNETETIYPGTELRLVHKTVLPKFP